MKKIVLLIVVCCMGFAVYSQTNFYSKSSGNLDALSTWGTSTDGTGTAPSDFTSADQVFNVVNNATPTIGAAWTVSGTNSKIVVGDGASNINFTIPTGFAVSGTIDVTASATLTHKNTTNPTFGTLDANSTVFYNGTSAQTIPAATFGNLTLSNATNFTMTSSVTVAGTATFTNGTLTVGANTLTLNGSVSGMSAARFLIGSASSNLTLGGSGSIGTLFFSQTTPLTTNNFLTFTMNGGGVATMGNAMSAATMTLTSGQLSLNGNLLTLKTAFSGSSSNYLIGSASSNLTVTATGALGTVYFDQTTPGTTNNIATFTCSGAAGTTTLGNDVTVSTALALSNANATIADGGNTITVSGNITGTGKHTGAGEIKITGASSTVSALGALGNAEFANSGTVSLSGGPSTIGTLTFTSSKLSLGANTLTLGVGSSVSGMSGSNCFVGGASSAISISATSDIGTIFFDQTTPGTSNNLNTFTISAANGKATLGNDLSVTTTLALTNAASQLADGGNTVTLAGNITGAGIHSGAGKITMTGSAKSISNLAGTGNLEFNNSGAFTLSNNPTVTGTLTFTNGTLNIGAHTLIIGSGGTVSGMSSSRYFTGSASSNLTVSATADIGTLYFDQSSAGVSDEIATLTFSGAGSKATLGSNMTILTALALTSASSTFYDGGNIITLAGNITGSGTHSGSAGGPGSGKISMTGSAKTIAAVNIGNLELNNSGGFSLAGAAVINGTLTFTSGKLSIGTNTLKLNNTVSGMDATNSFTGSATSNLTIGATSDIGTIYFNQGTPGTTNKIATFLVNGGGSATLGNDMTVATALTLTSGKLAIGASTLTNSGSFSGNSSNYLIGSASSNLSVGASGTYFFDQTSAGTSNKLNSLTISAGTMTLGNAITVASDLSLTGTLADGGFTVPVGGNITGTGTHTSSTGGKISMTGTSKTISGATLGNLELNNSAGFSLSGGAIVTNTLTLTSGKLSIGAFTLRLNGGAVTDATNCLTGGATSNLTVGTTGTLGTLFFDQTSSTTKTIATCTVLPTATVTIGSPFIVSTTLGLGGTVNDNGNIITLQGNITGTGTHTSSTGGKITMTTASSTISGATLGNLELNNATGFSLSGSPTVNGTMTFTSGKLTLGANTLTLAGDVSGMSSSNYFVGNGASSNLTLTGASKTYSIFFDQSVSGATNKLATFTLNGAGTTVTLGNTMFVLTTLALTNGTLDDNGTTITLTGNITGSGTHTGSGKILMNGATKTISGATLGNLELNNAAFSLTGNATINGALTTTAAQFTIGAFTLTLNGTVASMSATNFLIGSATSNLTIGATGALGTLFFKQTAAANRTIDNFIVNGGGSVTLGSATIVNSALTLTSGKLAIGANLLTLNGTFTGSSSNYLTGSASSNLTLAGASSSIGTLYFDQTTPGTTNKIASFIMTGGGTATVGSDLNVATALTLTSGKLGIAAATLTNNGTITSTASNYLIGSASANLTVGATGTYFFDQTTAGTSNNVNTLNISAGTLTLGNAVTVGSGGLTLTGNLADGGFTVPVNGNISGAGTHTGAGKIKMTGASATISGATLQNLELNNASGFSLAGSPTINGALTATSGALSIGANTLTLHGTVASMDGTSDFLIGSASSNLSITPTSALGTLYFDQSTPGTSNNIATLTMNGAGGSFTLGNDASVGTTLAITTGTINDNGNVITLAGNITGTGTHTSTTGGKISMTGASATISGATLGNVELNNASGFSLSASPTVNGTLTFTSGKLTLGANTLNLAGDASGMSSSNYFIANGTTSALNLTGASKTYSIFFDQTSPGTTDKLNTFTLNGSGSTVTTGSNMQVLTTLTLTSGTLNDGGNTITLAGNIAGTGTHTGTGKITMTGATKTISGATLGNLELNNAAFSLTGSATINGALTMTAGQFTIGAFTLTLNGAVASMSTTNFLIGAATSNLTIGSTGALGTLFFKQTSAATRTINNFVMSGGGTATLGSAMDINTALTLTSGKLAIGANTLTLAGTFTGTSSNYLIGNASANLTISKAGSSAGTIYFDQSTPGTTNNVATLTMSGATGSATLGNNISVGTALALSTASATINDGGNTIALAGNITGTGTHTSSAGGKISMTGASKTVSGATLGNLELNNSLGFSLSGSAIVTNTLTLTSGKLSIGANTLRLNGGAVTDATNCVTGGATSNLTVGTTGTLGTLYFDQTSSTTKTIATCTVLPTATVTIGNPFIVSTTLGLGGTVNDNGNIITLQGNITGAGTHSSATGGKITMTGATKTISGATLGNLELNNAAFSLTGSATVTGTLTVTAGQFTVGSNTLTLNGGVASMTAANFLIGSATSNLTLGGAGNIGTLFFKQTTPGTTNNFATFTLNGGGTATLGNALSVGTTLALTSGTLADNGQTVTLAGDITGTGTHSGSGKILMNGASKTVSGATLGNLQLNNASGFSLTGSPTVNGTLTLTSGRWDIGSNNLIFGSAATAVAGSPTSSNMIIATGGGEVRKNMSSNGTFVFPIGDATPNYTPITLAFTGGTYGGGAYAATNVVASKHSANSSTTNYINRYWNVNTNAITAPVYSVTATYVTGDVVGTEASMSGAQYSGTLPWIRYSAVNSGTHSLSTTSITTTTNAISAISGTNPSVTITPANTTACNGDATALTANPTGDPAFTYTWAPSTALSATTGASVTASPTNTGTVTAVFVYTVTMTDGNGFTATSTTTVNVNPAAAITGTTNACIGLTSTLSNPISGGTWSSSDDAIATVGSATGDVTGVAGGTATISYTSGTGCVSTIGFTVNTNPAIVTGTVTTICSGRFSTYADATPGGTWSSADISIATVGSTTGLIQGQSGGTTTISYTLTTTGCYATKEMTVIQGPAAITTTTINVCTGSTITLSDVTPGGTWSSSSITKATVGSTTGIVTGIAAAAPTITYKLNSNGCFATKQITVSTTPQPITGTKTVCEGGTTLLGESSSGGSWTSADPSIASVGTGSPVVTGVTAGTVTISYTNTGTGCGVGTTVTVNPTPSAIITGGATIVCTGTSITLTDGTPGGTWDASNTRVTVGSTSGIVTGVTSGGTVDINYKLSTGCKATATFSVNASPSTITGTSSVCEGLTTTLADGTSDGTWSSSDNSLATVGSSTGVVTGVAAGNPVITYIVSNGCTALKAVTVNPSPSAITGSTAVCTGSTITLGNSVSGGTWSSSNTGVATVGSASGIVTGVVPGTATITYTLSAGCTAISTITVNETPFAITGSGATCPGLSLTLSDTYVGGTWSSSDASLATVGSTTGIVTGVAAGNPVISYTLSNGCSALATVTVNPLPASITGSSTSACVGNTFTLSDATGGGYWTSSNTHASVGSTSGVVTGLTTGDAVISYTLSSTGCYQTQTVTIYNFVSTITGPSSVCEGATITLHNDDAGTWSSSDASLATIGSSTGVVTGVAAGTPVITYTETTGCIAIATITVSPTPSAISGTTSVCVGSTTTLGNSVAGGVWTSGNTSVATVGSSSGIVTGVVAVTAPITYTLPAGCAAYTTVTVNPVPYAIDGSFGVCPGSTTDLSDDYTASSGVWSSSNTGIATVGSTTGTVTGVATGNVTISYSLSTGCAATAAVTVNPLPASISGSTTVCIGATTTLTDGTAGGHWENSNTHVSVGSATGIVTGLTEGSVTIRYVMNATGCMSTLNMTVNPNPSVIFGVTTFDVGTTTTLSSGTSGGTWSSDNVSIASIGSASGIATGNEAGTTTITYALSTGCYVTTSVDVTNPGGRSGGNVKTQVDPISEDIVVYPNPATTTSFAISTIHSGKFILYSIEGKEVARYTISRGVSLLELPQGLAQGVYLGMFKGDNGGTGTVRLLYNPQ